jgi:hypothetical protein
LVGAGWFAAGAEVVGWSAAETAGCPDAEGCCGLCAVCAGCVFWLGADELFGLHPLNESVMARLSVAKRANRKRKSIVFIPDGGFSEHENRQRMEFIRKGVDQNK